MSIKKYQVFLSSTYENLKNERLAVLRLLLKMDCIPTGMEYFTASDETQFEVIKSYMKLSDYYVLLIGEQYGTICDKTHISYTEMEYRYALELKIPILSFIKTNIPENNIPQFASFIKKIKKGRLVSFWNDETDLCMNVSSSIMNCIKKNERPGWVRNTNETLSDSLKGSIYDEIEYLKIKRVLDDGEDFNAKHIGEKLFYIWKSNQSLNGYTKEEFALSIGLDPQEVDAYFEGKKQINDYYLLKTVIQLYNLPDDYFIKAYFFGKSAPWKKDIVRYSILNKIKQKNRIKYLSNDFYRIVIEDYAFSLHEFKLILYGENHTPSFFSTLPQQNLFQNFTEEENEVVKKFSRCYYKLLEFCKYKESNNKISPMEQIIQYWFYLDDDSLWYLFTEGIVSIDITTIESPVITYTFFNDLLKGTISWHTFDYKHYRIKKTDDSDSLLFL